MDHCNENKDFYCFACVKEGRKEPEKQQQKQYRPQFNERDFPKICFVLIVAEINYTNPCENEWQYCFIGVASPEPFLEWVFQTQKDWAAKISHFFLTHLFQIRWWWNLVEIYSVWNTLQIGKKSWWCHHCLVAMASLSFWYVAIAKK